MSKEYLLVLPIDPIQYGNTYPQGEPIPLHCTVMHWFKLQRIVSIWPFFETLQQQVASVAPIELVSDQPALFGPNENVPVHTLERNSALTLLHTNIFRLLVKMSSEPDELRWVGAGYRPHVTNVGTRVFASGSRHIVDRLALIERDEAKLKRVIAVYGFKDVK